MHPTDNIQTSTNMNTHPATTRERDIVRWYVCRYRVLTNEIRTLETFSEEDIKIFFPFVERKHVVKGQTSLTRKPLLPGFIFARASLSALEVHPRLKSFAKMKSHDEASRYITIRDDDMENFMWAARGFQELDLFSYDDSSQELYDIIEFGDDSERTIYAFLETLQGKKGGNFIIPLSQDSLAQACGDNEKLKNFKLLKGSLCYKETAVNREFRIRRISPTSKYHSKFINSADKVSKEALADYIAGKPIRDKVQKKLEECLFRYNGVAVANIKFQAKIYAVLFRCAAILERTNEAKDIEKTIRKEIIPAYRLYIKGLSKYNQPKAQKNLHFYIQDIEKTKHS